MSSYDIGYTSLHVLVSDTQSEHWIVFRRGRDRYYVWLPDSQGSRRISPNEIGVGYSRKGEAGAWALVEPLCREYPDRDTAVAAAIMRSSG